MTDHQIVQFILHRAETNGKVPIVNPRLVIYKNMSSLILAVKAENYKDVFMLRFLNNNTRGLFKLKIQDSQFEDWKNSLIKEPSQTYALYSNSFTIDYDFKTLPDFVKHYVSYAIIEALKTKGMGFDLFSISCADDPVIVNPNETYEEAAIETDLMDFGFDMPTKLTSL